ncbi:MAG: hypothetical protein JNM78_08740 [Cyclobacteriaceae bacterium]|nr:hypothetical protein [Cyclobacteriaceae bacterium]
MKLEKALYDRSYLYFVAFFLFVLVAFWLTYVTKLFDQESYRMHLHGITLFVWCSLLIVQPFLIRQRKYIWHKRFGKFSYVLVPLLIITTVDLLHFRLGQNPLRTIDFFFSALVLNALVGFLILYGLAIYNRKKPVIHARYMVSSVFLFFTPVTDRIISIFFPAMLKYFPTLDGSPIEALFGFLLADIMLIGLCIWDWRSHKRFTAFPIALVILLLYHFSVLNFYKFEFWKSFTTWFVGQ